MEAVLNRHIRRLRIAGLLAAIAVSLFFIYASIKLGLTLFAYNSDPAFTLYKVDALIGSLFSFGFALILIGTVWAFLTITKRIRLFANSVIMYGFSHVVMAFVIKASFDYLKLGLKLSKLWFLLPLAIWFYSIIIGSRSISHKKPETEPETKPEIN